MKKNSHSEFSAAISRKTPSELVRIKHYLKQSEVPYKEAKIFLIEKLLLKVVR